MFRHEYLFSISLPSPPQSLPPGFFLVNPLHPTLNIFPPLLKSLRPFLSEIEDMEWSFRRVKRMNVTAAGTKIIHSFRFLAVDCLIDLIDGHISQSLVIFNSISLSTSFCQFLAFLTFGFAFRLYAIILLYSLVLWLSFSGFQEKKF